MIVRSHLPWPLRWAVLALVFGFSAALALWAFEFGKNIAGLDRHSEAQVVDLRSDLEQLRAERDKAQSIANTAESLLMAERTTQERLASQLKALEAENLGLKGDLGFFERLLPAGAGQGVAVRGLQAEVVAPGQLQYQLLVMQPGRSPGEFSGRFELQLSGRLDGKPWTLPAQAASAPALQFKQYQRVGGTLQFPALAVVEGVQVRVVDGRGALRASQDIRL
ncbi:MAG TPA: DUF6776 family protein [Methylibium sp.]|nr:DUF6776 family protein [Methylibium sp.]